MRSWVKFEPPHIHENGLKNNYLLILVHVLFTIFKKIIFELTVIL